MRRGSSRRMRVLAGALATMLALDRVVPMSDGYNPFSNHFLPLYDMVTKAFRFRFLPEAPPVEERFGKDRSYLIGITPHGFFPWAIGFICIKLALAGFQPNIVGASVLGALPIAGRILRSLGYQPATP